MTDLSALSMLPNRELQCEVGCLDQTAGFTNLAEQSILTYTCGGWLFRIWASCQACSRATVRVIITRAVSARTVHETSGEQKRHTYPPGLETACWRA